MSCTEEDRFRRCGGPYIVMRYVHVRHQYTPSEKLLAGSLLEIFNNSMFTLHQLLPLES